MTDWPVLFEAFPALIIGAPLGAWIGTRLHRRDVRRGVIPEED